MTCLGSFFGHRTQIKTHCLNIVLYSGQCCLFNFVSIFFFLRHVCPAQARILKPGSCFINGIKGSTLFLLFLMFDKKKML